MSKRMSIPKDVEAEVLFKADHTCSVCHKSNKGIQVDHIDGNRNNNRESNLIVLCLHHHDKKSSKSPMSKGYSAKELKKYKENWEMIVRKRRKALYEPPKMRLIRFDGPDVNTVYLETEPGKLRAFQEPLTFELLGFNWGNVDIYPEEYKKNFLIETPLKKISESKKIRLRFSNGTLANEVYVVWEDGRKHHVPDPGTLKEIGGFKEIDDIDYRKFNAIPHGQPLENIFTIRTNRLLKEAMEKSP
jgi:hypothetical protein